MFEQIIFIQFAFLLLGSLFMLFTCLSDYLKKSEFVNILIVFFTVTAFVGFISDELYFLFLGDKKAFKFDIFPFWWFLGLLFSFISFKRLYYYKRQ